MQTLEVLPYSQLSKRAGYEFLDLKSYNTLKKVLPHLLATADKYDLSCRMGGYGGISDLERGQVRKHKCGTVACIVGLFPLITGVKKEDFDKIGDLGFNYQKYQERVIPKLCKEGDEYAIWNRMWKFLFSSEWEDYQETFEQGVERMRIVLSGNYNPDWSYTEENLIN